MKLDIETARKMVAAIEEDLCGRRGLRQEWEGIDADVQEEIRRVWTGLIQEAASTAGDVAAGERGTGPATKMRETFEFIAAHSQAPTAIRSAAERVVMDITPATLEAMDAAAALVEAELTPRRTLEDCHVDFEAEIDGQTVALSLEGRELSVEAERALAVLLMQREIQRRKGGGA